MKVAVCDDNQGDLHVIEVYLDALKQSKADYDFFQSGEMLLAQYEKHGEDILTVFFVAMMIWMLLNAY